MDATNMNYGLAHANVKRARGRAKDYVCRCGDRADHWALAWWRAEHLIDTMGQRFSGNAEDYDPLCASCHRKMDAQTPLPYDADEPLMQATIAAIVQRPDPWA